MKPIILMIMVPFAEIDIESTELKKIMTQNESKL